MLAFGIFSSHVMCEGRWLCEAIYFYKKAKTREGVMGKLSHGLDKEHDIQ